MRTFTGISIRVIPHETQRYETAGDYFFDELGCLQIRVSDLGDVRKNMLIVVHELVEVILTEYDNISEPIIKAFDEEFETRRIEGNIDEPGDDPNAPYKNQHGVATGFEKIMAALMAVDWKEYEDDCNRLFDK